MTKLVMVRHGQSQANLDNRFTGWSDVPLTAKGIAQGKEVGAELAAREFNFTDVHTSYMKRAIMTADCILEALDQLCLPILKAWRRQTRSWRTTVARLAPGRLCCPAPTCSPRSRPALRSVRGKRATGRKPGNVPRAEPSLLARPGGAPPACRPRSVNRGPREYPARLGQVH